MFCITTGLVRMDSYFGIARLVLLVTLHLVLCFFPCRQARDARHHGRLGPQDSVEVHRCSSWTRFSPCPLLCYECLGPDSALHSLASPQLQFFTVVDFLLRYRGLFHADHSVSPAAPVHVVDVPCHAGCAVSQVVCSSWTR